MSDLPPGPPSEPQYTPPPAEPPPPPGAPSGDVPFPPPAAPLPAAPQPLTALEERQWAMLAHLSVLLNLVTGFLGVIAPLVIYLIYKDRSRFVAFHSMQAFVFQLVWWAGGGLLLGLMWGVVGALSAIFVGILCVPFAALLTPVLLLMPLVALIYGTVVGVQVNGGRDVRYWLIGDWVARNMRP